MKLKSVSVELGQDRHTSEQLSHSIGSDVTKRIEEKSGIKSRRVVSEDQDCVSLAKSLLQRPEILSDTIRADLIIIVSESKNAPIPPISSLILDELKILHSTVVLDLDSGCAGYVQALQIVDAFFRVPGFKQAVIVTTDAYSRFVDHKDRSVAPIFGDGASISVFENDGEASLFTFDNGTDASRYQFLQTNNAQDRSLKMNGAEILMFVKAEVMQSIRTCVEKVRLQEQEIDYFFFHQASELVIKELRSAFSLSADEAPFKVGDTGNLVSTSIPFVMSEYVGQLAGKRILCSGFGVGLTWATAILDLT